MSEITVAAMAKAMQTVLREELDPIHADLAEIKNTLEVHTRALDTLLKEVNTKADEKVVSAERVSRLEKWAVLAGEKIGVKLEL